MLRFLIQACIKHAAMVLLVVVLLLFLAVKALYSTPVDAIPDLSDTQVIVKINYPGQSPDVVEEQITYPLSTLLMSVPGAETVRGYSFFGDAYLYIIFDEDSDIYWARARVVEYLNQAQQRLPATATMSLGPDASGVGWIFQYVLTATNEAHNLADLTSLQDWFIAPELQSVSGVSEIAKVGGMVQTYQVVVDPLKLLHFNLPIGIVSKAIQAANGQVGGSVIEMAEAEYMVRSSAYLSSIEDIQAIPLPVQNNQGTPLTLADIATIRLGPETRRGVAEWNGEGEVVGGIVIMRDGANALTVIENIKSKIATLQSALPKGVTITTAYDRSLLITKAIDNIKHRLIEEIALVSIICGLLLFHARGTFIIVICLPTAMLMGFLMMRIFDINANLMSLGGIAIAIGALVDAAIVMVENVHKKLEAESPEASPQHRQQMIIEACQEVGPTLFLSLLIITLSFVPVFSLAGQEGKLFSPLAFTKTFVMAAAAILSITLVPVLISLLMKGKMQSEDRNPLNRWLKALYRPLLNSALRFPKMMIVLSLLIGLSSWYPLSKLDSEFMPTFDEGDLLYMPTTLPGVSIQEAGQILQQTDRLIKTIPEVKSVFGKVGRAETATDPAPLTMIETTIQLKPKNQWRSGMTLEGIIAELDATVRFPGLTNAWVQPIKTRIDMLSTGLKTRVGLKVAGDTLESIEDAGLLLEKQLKGLPGTQSVLAERPMQGRYIDIIPNRFAAAKYGVSIAEIQQVVRQAIGGQEITESIQGRHRYPINLRYPRHYRDNIDALKALPFITENGTWLTLSQVADVQLISGPATIKSENARMIGWIFIDTHPDMDFNHYLLSLEQTLASIDGLPAKVTVDNVGEYQYLERVKEQMQWIIPITIGIIFLLLMIATSSLWQSVLVLLTLPIALAGSLWLVYWLGYAMSVAMAVGMLALAGIAAEFGLIMLIYLNRAKQQTHDSADEFIVYGALQRVRPKAMSVLTIIASLVPIMLVTETGSEVMHRLAAPMLGGMLLCPVISMLLIPAVYKIMHSRPKS
ncbi:MAG: efflux RND transporter permease subunit [Aestuariibacter sp.]